MFGAKLPGMSRSIRVQISEKFSRAELSGRVNGEYIAMKFAIMPFISLIFIPKC
jgi:hypothetical protein